MLHTFSAFKEYAYLCGITVKKKQALLLQQRESEDQTQAVTSASMFPKSWDVKRKQNKQTAYLTAHMFKYLTFLSLIKTYLRLQHQILNT